MGMIKGDGTTRTLNSRCLAVCCLGGPCTIAFWHSGDACTECSQGAAFTALALNCVGFFLPLIGVPFIPCGSLYACCCWAPNPAHFQRTPQMHGSREQQENDMIAGAGVPVVAQAVAVAVAVPAKM